MMNEVPLNIKELFSSLSDDGKKLLLSMEIAEESGMPKEHLISVAGLPADRLEKAISELRGQKLIEQGRNEQGKFIAGEGERYRLVLGLPAVIRKDILNLE